MYPCRAPNCPAYVDHRGGVCDQHADLPSARAEINRRYDERNRDVEAKAFYNSAEWKRARERKLASNPVCEFCGMAWATVVHHRIPLSECTFEERTAQENLMSSCNPCHTTYEMEKRRCD